MKPSFIAYCLVYRIFSRLSTGWQEKDGSAPETFARTKRTFKNPTDTIKNPAFPKKSRIFVLLQEIRIARVLAVIAPVRFRGYTDRLGAPEIHLLHHEVNRGKGAALKTAFRWFLDNCPEGAGVVTVDGDNQHHPEDTRACCEKMLETGHCILGCRDFTLDHVPNRSRFGNHTTSLVFKTFVGMTISDTQTGLRALPREAVEELVDVAGDRFEYETNMLLAFKEKAIPFEENKIRTVYIEENKSSHFRTFVDSWRIYKLILAHFFRYTINSIVCAAVDTGLFTLFTALLKKALEGFALTAAAGVGARVISSLLNFFLNKKLVFRTNADTGKTLLRYYCLAVPQMLLQILLTDGAYVLFHVKPTGVLHTLIYVVVMILLYIIGYMIQQRWVFAPQKQNEPEVEKK